MSARMLTLAALYVPRDACTPLAFRVLLLAAHLADEEGQVTLNRAWLTGLLSTSPRTILRAVTELRHAGLLASVSPACMLPDGTWRSTTYAVLPALDSAPPVPRVAEQCSPVRRVAQLPHGEIPHLSFRVLLLLATRAEDTSGEDAGLSVAEAAEDLGCVPSTIGNVLSQLRTDGYVYATKLPSRDRRGQPLLYHLQLDSDHLLLEV